MPIGGTNRHAKQLRRDATDVETLLWQRLRGRQLNGLKFRRQATVGHAVADFLCAEKRLVIELDGGQHSAEADADRTAALDALGYQVVRFWNHEVLDSLDGVLERIVAEAQRLPSRFESEGPSSNSG